MKQYNELEQLRQYQKQKLPDCPLCVNWFLGCLHGRREWKNKAVTPNLRYAGQSGKEYKRENISAIPVNEYPLRMYCDAFTWDPNPERLGRVCF